ncbi:MAG: response regulator [Chloracidobacterium sp. CP2_5A]|nr:MAG: response regulator [Chloracidobacterium sp. CP2_5A]
MGKTSLEKRRRCKAWSASTMGLFDKVRSMREQVVDMIGDMRQRHDIEELERRLTAAPEDIFLMQQLSDAYQNAGQGRRAVDLLCRIGEIYQARKNGEMALAYFRRAERLAASDERLRLLRVMVDLMISLGRYADAFERARQVVEILLSHDELAAARGYVEALPPLGEHDAKYRKELVDLVNISRREWAQGARGTWLDEPGERLFGPERSSSLERREQFPHQTILVVDDEPGTCEVLTLCLRRLGCGVVTAEDGVQAQEVALQHRPSLIICDLLMPRMDGRQFFDWTRRHPALKEVPFVCLSSRGQQEERLAAFERGVEDYWVKPFSAAELTFRVKNLLRRLQSDADFRGKLHEVSFPEILQITEAGRKNGILKVTSDGREATFYLREGQILDAELETYRGERVAYVVIRWLRGEFSFRSAAVDCPARITLPTQQLLLEAVRRYDESQSLMESEPDLDRPYIVSEAFALMAVPDDFAEEISFLKSLFDGHRSFGDCLRALEDNLEAMTMLIELRREGLLIPAPAGWPQAPSLFSGRGTRG